MDKSFNWKPYLIASAVAVLVLGLINYRMALGYFLGTVCYFVNDKLVSNKFKNLQDTSIVANIMFYMLLQMLIVGISAYATWWLGKLQVFIVYCIGIMLPKIYYTIMTVFINK